MRSTWKACSILGMIAVAALLHTASARAQDWQTVGYADSANRGELKAEIESLEHQLNGRLAQPGYGGGACCQPGCAVPGCAAPGCCVPGCAAPGCCVPGCASPGCASPGCASPGCCAPTCGCAPSCCAPMCCASMNHCCRPEGWVYGAEVLYLKPHNSVGTGLSDFATSIELEDGEEQFNIDPDFDLGYRVWFGYTRCDGLGWRITYWSFDTSHGEEFGDDEDEEAFAEIDQSWDASYFDIEATYSTNWCGRLDATFSSGVRWVDYEESMDTEFFFGDVETEASTEFQSIGLTFATELRYRVNCNLGLYSRFRSSIVMDDEDISVEIDVFGDEEEFEGTQKNDVRFIHEIAIGAEYIMPMCCGGYYYVRAGAEMSYWDGFGLNTTVPDTDEPDFFYGLQNNSSTGFAGFSISAGVQR